MKKAPHGGSNHLGVGVIDRSGAEQDCSEPEPVRRPQQCTKIVGIIDLVEQQEAIMLHCRQISYGRHCRNGRHRDNPFRILILAELTPFLFTQAVNIDFPQTGRQGICAMVLAA